MPKHVIVGGGIAGFSVLDELLNQGEEDILLISKEEYPLYNRVNIKNYPKDLIDIEGLLMKTEEDYGDKVEILLDTEMKDIDTESNCIITDSGEFDYQNLALAIGGTPRKIPAENNDLPEIHYLWTMNQAEQLKDRIEKKENAIVVGGGLLGIDLASIFAEKDLDTTYLIRGQHWWRKGLCEPGSEMVENAMEDYGVRIVHGEEVEKFIEDNSQLSGVKTQKDNFYSGDVAGVAVGLDRNTKIADQAGIEVNEGILADKYLETSEENIYAAGDVAEYEDIVLEEKRMYASWDSAMMQGKTVGKNMTGENAEHRFVSVYTVNHFGLNIISVGEAIKRGDKEAYYINDENGYLQLNTRDGRIIGGIMINRQDLLAQLKSAIMQKKDISEFSIDLEIFKQCKEI